ncbi:DUF2062 domain-containing protein [Pelagibacterium xiamenense]|uniref:DUF2062 domain-containing protein n=1 Tax=Pelagibacterium xiamenense TaxID=2901140 RepID=UPI001E63293A|nr:DUF2062 domain-containing protein [Pelagibacterium xiamenense]MCD7058971.1 DUF2062 domain-containing protein [Pelagibacterium xiamenense]
MSTPSGPRKKSVNERVRDMIWPRMGLRRYLTYLQKKVLRLSASPHAIGAGVASGAAVSVFPLVGLHFFLGFVLAFVTRGNMLAAAIGTAWGNPVTFPLFFSLSYQFGSAILGLFKTPGTQAVRMSAENTEALSGGLFALDLGQILPLFQTMMVGALPLALFTWAFFYILVRGVVTSFQIARRARLAARRGNSKAPPGAANGHSGR